MKKLVKIAIVAPYALLLILSKGLEYAHLFFYDVISKIPKNTIIIPNVILIHTFSIIIVLQVNNS
jgi:hypothetical protein